MTSKKDVSVTHSNYDVIFKYLTEMFEDKALTFYGLETPPIVRAEKTHHTGGRFSHWGTVLV